MTMATPRRNRRCSAFSLIELLVVMLIVAIVVAIGVPNYQRHLMRSHRAHARLSLLQAAHWMERQATIQGRYPQTLPQALTASDGGHYRVDLAPPPPAGPADDAALRFDLRAVPQGPQALDPCGTFTLAHTGERGVSGPGANAADCWHG